jgi:rfaE bifunctional protein kinase chain/domain
MPDTPTAPSPERLLELVERLAGQPVLLLADLVADRFIRGTPKRISREAPVLILSVESEGLVPGGGANAVANIAALGGEPLPVGVVGDDESGRGLVAALDAAGVETAGIAVLADYRTPTKTRVLGGGRHSVKQQIVRFDVEDSVPAAVARAGIEDSLGRLGGRARLAVLSDYGYGAVVPELMPAVRSATGAEGVVLCDSRYRLGDFVGADGATPNEEEAEALAGQHFNDDDTLVETAGAALRSRLAARFLLITRGSRGMSLVEEARVAHLAVHGTDQVADVTGAGDTVIGTFALALAAGASPLEAALLANYAGGVVVAKEGTATVAPDELRWAVESDPRPLEEIRWARS